MSLCPFESLRVIPLGLSRGRGEAVPRILPRPSFAKRFRPQLTLCDHAQSAASTASASPNTEDQELLGHFGFVLEGLREKSSLLQRESNRTCQREPL